MSLEQLPDLLRDLEEELFVSQLLVCLLLFSELFSRLTEVTLSLFLLALGLREVSLLEGLLGRCSVGLGALEGRIAWSRTESFPWYSCRPRSVKQSLMYSSVERPGGTPHGRGSGR